MLARKYNHTSILIIVHVLRNFSKNEYGEKINALTSKWWLSFDHMSIYLKEIPSKMESKQVSRHLESLHVRLISCYNYKKKIIQIFVHFPFVAIATAIQHCMLSTSPPQSFEHLHWKDISFICCAYSPHSLFKHWLFLYAPTLNEV